MRSLFLVALLYVPASFASAYVDICDRGVIGVEIAKQTGAASCSAVSTKDMAALIELDFAWLSTRQHSRQRL